MATSPADAPMMLNAQERQNPLWLKIVAELDRRVQRLRVENDASVPLDRTEFTRGQIAALLSLRRLNTPRQVAGVETDFAAIVNATTTAMGATTVPTGLPLPDLGVQ